MLSYLCLSQQILVHPYFSRFQKGKEHVYLHLGKIQKEKDITFSCVNMVSKLKYPRPADSPLCCRNVYHTS